jgi:hypothetical protein
VTSILTNAEAEQLLLDIRVGRAAANADIGESEGAFVVFPTSIVVTVPGRGHNVFPLCTTTEPGASCRGTGSSSITSQVDGVTVEGTFWWSVHGPAPCDALPSPIYRFRRGGYPVPRPAWADQLPRSQWLYPLGSPALSRQRTRLVRRGRSAEYELLARTAKVFEHCCRGPLRRVIALRPLLDAADVVQRAMQVAARLLPVYASAARPPCSWLGMIQLDGRRDLHRSVSQLDWLPRDLAEVLGRIEKADVKPHDDPTVTLAAVIEAAVAHHQPLPRATPRQIEAALAAPQLIPLNPGPSGPALAGPEILGRLDPGLQAADEERGVWAASVGRLVRAEPALVVLASLGDDEAIDRIGERVVAALRQPGESKATTRARCRQEFHTAGRLFSSADGVGRFGAQAPAAHLARLDAALATPARRPAS